MKVTIVGAGNMGLAMVAYMAINKKAEVTLFTKKDILKEGPLKLKDIEENSEACTCDFLVTDDPRKAFETAEIVFVTYPAFLRVKFVADNEKYFQKDSCIGFVSGYGGIEYACQGLKKRGVNIFGLQRVPYVARVCEYEKGKEANILSKKRQLYIGAIPKAKAIYIAQMVEKLLDIPVQILKEYLAVTMVPSNPLLHITGLYNIFKDYIPGQKYEKPLKFYEEWNDDASRMLFSYDAEVQNICKALSPLDLSEVISLPVYYEVKTPEQMTKKLKSIEGFKAVMAPLKKCENGYVLDLESRMFVEDYPYGICIFKELAMMTGVTTPTIDILLDFYYKISGKKYFESDGTCTSRIKETGTPTNYGLLTKEDILEFYRQEGEN